MEDTLELVLKIQTEQGAKLDELSTKFDGIKKKSAETSEGFGIMDTRIGGMWKTFTGGVQKGVASLVTFKGALAATGIGLLVIAVAAVYNWFQKTEGGADILARVMGVLGQVIKDGPIVVFNALKTVISAILLPIKTIISFWKEAAQVLSGKQGIKEAYKDFTAELEENTDKVIKNAKATVDATKTAVDNAKAADALAVKRFTLDDKERENKVKDAELEAQIAALREKAFDLDTTAIDKKAALLEMEKLQAQQYKTNKEIAQEELDLTNEELRLYPDKEKALEDEANKRKALADVERKYSADKRLTNRLMSAGERQATSDLKKELDERLKILIASETLAGKELEAIRKKAVEEMKNYTAKLRDASLGDTKKIDFEKAELTRVELMHERGLTSEEEYQDELMRIKIEYETLTKNEIDLIKEQNKNDDIERDKEVADKKKQLQQQIKDALIAVASESADAYLSIQQNRLDKAKERELSNKNLTEAQKDAINKKYLEKQKKQDIETAIIKGGLAVLSALTSTPFFPTGLIMGIVATAMTVIQVAKIAATKYSLGGMVNGAKHAEGGVNVEAEGGEMIVNARTMANPIMAAEIKRMNDAGNTGKQYNGSNSLNEDSIANAVIKAVKAIPVQLSEYRTTEAQRNVAVRESNFTV